MKREAPLKETKKVEYGVSKKKLKHGRLKMNSNAPRTIELKGHLTDLASQYEGLLSTLGLLKFGDEEISNIEFGNIKKQKNGDIPLKFTISPRKEVLN